MLVSIICKVINIDASVSMDNLNMHASVSRDKVINMHASVSMHKVSNKYARVCQYGQT